MDVVAEPVRLMTEPLQELRHAPEPRGIRAAEQGNEGDRRSLLRELSRQLERDRATGAVAGDGIGTVGPECPDPLGKVGRQLLDAREGDRKSTRLNSSHVESSYAVFCLKKNT